MPPKSSKAKKARAATAARTPLGSVKALPFPGRIIRSGDTDPAVVLAVQRRLNQVGVGPIDEDGVFGPQTTAATKLFQARFPDVDGQPLKIDGAIGPVTWAALFGAASVPVVSGTGDALLKAALEVAGGEIGVKEQPLGSNRGPRVDQYLRAAGLDPTKGHFAWCAAFVYFCFNEAAKTLNRKNPVIKTAGVLDHWERAESKGIPQVTAAKVLLDPSLVRPGQIFVIDVGDPGGAGHTGLIEKVVAGKLVTIEGNTNDGGSAEGIGVFRRNSRKIADINVGFIDYTGR